MERKCFVCFLLIVILFDLFCGVFVIVLVYNKNMGGVDGVDM